MWSLPDLQRLNLKGSPTPSGHDGAPDDVTPGQRQRISEETRRILMAACRAATMDGFLLVAPLIPRTVAKDGYVYLDRNREGTLFTNVAEGDLAEILTYAAARMKGGR